MEWWDPGLALAGLLVGVIVGLTGMGGGALMTPILVLFFGVPPLAAVSSDVVASLFMKPIGGLVHLRRGTVHLDLVRWLCLGSVPGAFCGVLVLRLFGDGEQLQDMVKILLGVVLTLASLALVAKAYHTLRDRTRTRAAGTVIEPADALRVPVRRGATLVAGAVAGLIVGMTSVGAGSILIISLLALYPRLTASQLVGTDLVQAVPLVASASVGHLLFGDFSLGLTMAILVGAIPGVFLGAQASSRAPGGVIRRALALVMLASGIKLLGASNGLVGAVVLGALMLGSLMWAFIRVCHGEAPTAGLQRRRAAVDGRTCDPSGSYPPPG